MSTGGLTRLLALALFGALAQGASAATGVTVLPAPADTGPVTVFYPTAAAPSRLVRGAFAFQLAADAAPLPGNGRLVVMSHGSGGSPWPQADLAIALTDAGFTVAMPDKTTLERWTDPRIVASVAAVPMAAPVDMASLATPRIPLGLVRAGKDGWLAPQWHIDAVREGGKRCVLVADMSTAGHGSILSPMPPELPPRAARLLNDPPGFDRASLPAVYASIGRFFVQNLAP